MGAAKKQQITPAITRSIMPSSQTLSDDILSDGEKTVEVLKSIHVNMTSNQCPPPTSATSDCWTDKHSSSKTFGLPIHHLPDREVETNTNWIGCGKFNRYYKEAAKLEQKQSGNELQAAIEDVDGKCDVVVDQKDKELDMDNGLCMHLFIHK